MERYRYLIVGGGMVAGYAAQEFVAHGLQPGELAIVSADTVLPYERPPLSKGFLAGTEDVSSLLINQAGFYQEHGIDVLLTTPIERVDLQQRCVWLQNSDALGFEKLLVATGARVRTLYLPGGQLQGVHYLRTVDQARHIREQAAHARRAVVIGAGFIGMEVAAVLAQQHIPTTLVFPQERVGQRLFTPPLSAFFQRYYEARGVTIMPRTTVTALVGDEEVTGIVFDSGRKQAVDLVVAGIGVTPVTDLLEGTGLELNNGIVVDEYLETRMPGVYAAGDVANFRDVLTGRRRRVEHWDNAVEQGKHVARVMSGERCPFIHVPYFFSDLFDLSYEFWGDTEDADHVVHRGDVARGAGSVWWLKQGRVIGAFVMNRPDEEREFARRWIAGGHVVAAQQLQDDTHALGSIKTYQYSDERNANGCPSYV